MTKILPIASLILYAKRMGLTEDADDAENEYVLLRAERDGLGSELLKIQQECVIEHKANVAKDEALRMAQLELQRMNIRDGLGLSVHNEIDTALAAIEKVLK